MGSLGSTVAVTAALPLLNPRHGSVALGTPCVIWCGKIDGQWYVHKAIVGRRVKKQPNNCCVLWTGRRPLT